MTRYVQRIPSSRGVLIINDGWALVDETLGKFEVVFDDGLDMGIVIEVIRTFRRRRRRRRRSENGK